MIRILSIILSIFLIHINVCNEETYNKYICTLSTGLSTESAPFDTYLISKLLLKSNTKLTTKEISSVCKSISIEQSESTLKLSLVSSLNKDDFKLFLGSIIENFMPSKEDTLHVLKKYYSSPIEQIQHPIAENIKSISAVQIQSRMILLSKNIIYHNGNTSKTHRIKLNISSPTCKWIIPLSSIKKQKPTSYVIEFKLTEPISSLSISDAIKKLLSIYIVGNGKHSVLYRILREQKAFCYMMGTRMLNINGIINPVIWLVTDKDENNLLAKKIIEESIVSIPDKVFQLVLTDIRNYPDKLLKDLNTYQFQCTKSSLINEIDLLTKNTHWNSYRERTKDMLATSETSVRPIYQILPLSP